MPDEALTPPARSSRKSTWATCKRFVLGLPLSRFHSAVGTLAGIASITGAAFSLVHFVYPANTGDLVAIVQAAGSRRSVPDATVEVLTTQDAIVATLTPDSTGRVTQELTEGVYVVRVSHPLYALTCVACRYCRDRRSKSERASGRVRPRRLNARSTVE
jgi:hypothetical protein